MDTSTSLFDSGMSKPVGAFECCVSREFQQGNFHGSDETSRTVARITLQSHPRVLF